MTIVLNINELFLEKIMMDIQKENSLFLHLDRALPMIYTPAPWEDPEVGGYYLRPTFFVRKNDAPNDSLKIADLTRMYNVVDIVSRVPWRINNKVLDVV